MDHGKSYLNIDRIRNTTPSKFGFKIPASQVFLVDYLGVKNLPKYDYQLTGKRYNHLSDEAKNISHVLKEKGFHDSSLLAVDYFIWEELQVLENLSNFKRAKEEDEKDIHLTKYVASSQNSKKKFNQYYNIRSKIIHTGQRLKTELLYSEYPREERDEEYLTRIEILQLGKLAIVNWLLLK